MSRLPVIASFVLFLALCASVAYWGLAFYKPPLRQVAAPPAPAQDVDMASAAGLFGGRTSVAVASNYQLKGVIVADDPAGSVAILSADGKPARAYAVGTEISPGAAVKEVQPRFVLVSESGVVKRVDLPDTIKAQMMSGPADASPVGEAAQQQMQQQQMQQQQMQQQQMQQQQMQQQQMQPAQDMSGQPNPSMPPPQIAQPIPENQPGAGAPQNPAQQGQQAMPDGMHPPPGYPQPNATPSNMPPAAQ